MLCAGVFCSCCLVFVFEYSLILLILDCIQVFVRPPAAAPVLGTSL